MESWIATWIYVGAGLVLWPLIWLRLGGRLKDPVFVAGGAMQLLNSYLVSMEQPAKFDLVISQVKTVQAHATTLVAAAFAVAIFSLGRVSSAATVQQRLCDVPAPGTGARL